MIKKNKLKLGQIIYHKLGIKMIVMDLSHEDDFLIDCKFYNPTTRNFERELFENFELFYNKE